MANRKITMKIKRIFKFDRSFGLNLEWAKKSVTASTETKSRIFPILIHNTERWNSGNKNFHSGLTKL